MTTLDKLRHAWQELQLAKKAAETAHKHATDYSVVFGTTGFTIEHLEKALKLLEEAGRDLKGLFS